MSRYGSPTLFDSVGHVADSSAGSLRTVDGLRRLMKLPGIRAARAIKLAKEFEFWDLFVHAPAADVREVIGAAGPKAQTAAGDTGGVAPLTGSVRALCFFDDEWPSWLKSIKDPPAVIYIRGSLPTEHAIAIVGTREPTQFGEDWVHHVVKAAAVRGVGIVSGLAYGIDTIAHFAALENGILTWAILGGGVDCPSPAVNRQLAERIIATGGGLISEQPPGTEPTARSLVRRNRLQSAASDIVFVAQCGIPSGTLSTVRYAIEQHKTLVVAKLDLGLPPSSECAGNVALTDPQGCTPSILGAKGGLAKRIASRRPVASFSPATEKELDEIWGARNVL